MGFFDLLPAAAHNIYNYMKWNLAGSPGFTPGEIIVNTINGMSNAGRLMMTPPLPLPPGAIEDDAGYSQGQADPQAWQAFLQDQATRQTLGPRVALGMLGGGAGFSERGALGSSGARLVVARKMEDGSIKYGQPGQVHTDLMTRKELNADGPTPPQVEQSMGFAQPGGPFMNRQQALDFAAQNEPARAAYSLQQPQFGLEGASYMNNALPIPPSKAPIF